MLRSELLLIADTFLQVFHMLLHCRDCFTSEVLLRWLVLLDALQVLDRLLGQETLLIYDLSQAFVLLLDLLLDLLLNTFLSID